MYVHQVKYLQFPEHNFYMNGYNQYSVLKMHSPLFQKGHRLE